MSPAGEKVAAHLRDGVYTVGFTVAVTMVCIAAVSALQVATRERVALNAKLHLQRAVMEAAGLGQGRESEAVRAWYGASVEEIPGKNGQPPIFGAKDEAGDAQAWVFQLQGKGLWGGITAAVGLTRDLATITGVAFIEHAETPGLGARIEEAWFKRQFVGHHGPFTLATPDKGEERIDGITGATITTRGVMDILNDLRVKAPGWMSGTQPLPGRVSGKEPP